MAYVNSWKDETGSNSITVSGVTAGNTLLLMAVSDSGSSSVSAWPSGFTDIGQVTSTVDGGRLHAAIKESAGGSEGALSITASGTVYIMCAEFSGRDTASIYAFTTNLKESSTSTGSPRTIDSDSLTPSNGDTDIVALVMLDDGGNNVTTTMSTTAGTTGSWTTHQQFSNSNFRQGAVASCTQASAGAFTARATCTWTGANGGQGLILVGLKSASSGTTTFLMGQICV